MFPAGCTVTLVVLGELALLPLHAVAPPAAVVRYAPNARLAPARDVARHADASPRTVLAVDAPSPIAPYLPGARKEAEGGIQLSDGLLTLREVLLLSRGAHRLAVLSACVTDVPDLDMLDQVVSLPGALLQAGVAGVVASQWAVNDLPTAALMVRFHQLLAAGEPPAHALAAAQAWLRDVTIAELRPVIGDELAAKAAALATGHTDEGTEGLRPFAHPVDWAALTYTGA
jgi:hypothetical protein